MKIMIIDDERFSREGIRDTLTSLFPEMDMLPPMQNGVEGLAAILQHKPDIIVTDIRMPGMDGLELIGRLRDEEYDGEFIIVSGHDSFAYATLAMKVGVKHYILKPCKEPEMKRVVQQAMQDLQKRRQMQAQIESARANLDQLLPQIKQQFLNNMIFGSGFSLQEIAQFQTLYGTLPTQVRLFIATNEEQENLGKVLYLKMAVEQVLADYPSSILSVLGDKVIFIVDASIDTPPQEIGDSVLRLYDLYDYGTAFVSISDAGALEQIPFFYQQAVRMLDYRFFADGSTTITRDMMHGTGISADSISWSSMIETVIEASLRNDDKQYTELMNSFFTFLKDCQASSGLVRTYCFELLIAMARRINSDKVDWYVRRAVRAIDLSSLQQYRAFIDENIQAIKADSELAAMPTIIAQAIAYIDENIADSSLSVKQMATHVLFVRPDYFGKLFRKETGQKPSDFIRDKRLGLAKRLLRETKLKVYEICQQCGYGENVQYFSYVFRQAEGVTPSAYRDEL